MPGKGSRRGAGARRRDARQRRDQDHPRLRLPPGVDDRALPAADVLLVPDPGLGVDRLADGAEQAQRREVVLRRPLRAPLHEGADRRRRRVEDRDAVALDDVPEAAARGRVGRALVHQARRAVGERAVDDVGVPGDPADVGRAPVHVLVLEVEDPLRRRVRADEVAARRVEDALRLSGRAGGVQDVERVLRVHLLRRAADRGVLHQVVPPAVAPGVNADVRARPPHDDDVLDRGRVRERLVGDLLQAAPRGRAASRRRPSRGPSRPGR